MRKNSDQKNRLAFVPLFCLVIFTSSVLAAPPGYQLSPEAMQQAKELADKEFGRNFSRRRPSGLGDLDSDDAIRRILAQSMAELGHEDRKVQSKAQVKLKYLGNLAFPDLTEGLKSQNPIVRKKCAHLLAHRGSLAVALLSHTVRTDSERYVRATAASSLGHIFDPAAVPALLGALEEDDDFWVLISTIRALAYLKDRRAFEPLKKILDNSDADGQLRHAAAEALFRIDRETGTQAIHDVLQKKTNEPIRHNLNVVLASEGSYTYWPAELLNPHIA